MKNISDIELILLIIWIAAIISILLSLQIYTYIRICHPKIFERITGEKRND